MKNWMRILPLIFVLLVGFQVDSAFGQYYGKKKKKKKKKPTTEKVERTRSTPDSKGDRGVETKFADKLWYGGGANIGFNGNETISQFNLGISPMVGYKLTDRFSFGPRIGIDYNYIKFNFQGNTFKVQPVSFEYGVFTRFKILPIIFAHLEFTQRNEEVLIDEFGRVEFVDGLPVTNRKTLNDLNFGLGYTQDADLAYEIMLLWDFIQSPEEEQSVTSLPINLRLGFNFRF